PLRVVDDEVGSPTYAPDAAAAIRQLADLGLPGVYHVVNEGFCSRYELAVAALRIAGVAAPIEAIKSGEFRRDSTPPPFSPLHNGAAAALGVTLRPWQSALGEFVAAMDQEAAA
ncbi:MAG TPA: sugar nucleotide-binding protein, partial [Herpetosiphonaceae bacterium]|nr:sugar nucleotide-binding protein [Herpetosiphonaceae bacterium]